MKTSRKTLFTIILIIALSVLLPVLFAGRTDFPHLVVIGSVFSAVWDMQYVILQRYNRPMLVRLLRHMEARESRLAGRSAEEALSEQ